MKKYSVIFLIGLLVTSNSNNLMAEESLVDRAVKFAAGSASLFTSFSSGFLAYDAYKIAQGQGQESKDSPIYDLHKFLDDKGLTKGKIGHFVGRYAVASVLASLSVSTGVLGVNLVKKAVNPSRRKQTV